jgi:hypothetical protein
MAVSNLPIFLQTVMAWACQLNPLNQGVTVTCPEASPAVFTASGVAAANGFPFYLEGTTAPGGFTKGVVYYMVNASTDTFQGALYAGGSGINNTTSAGSAITLYYPITLAAGGANGSKVERITLYSTDATAHNLIFMLLDTNGVGHFIGESVTPTASANVATPVNVLTAANFPSAVYDANGNPCIYIPYQWTLAVMVINGGTAITAGATIDVVATGGNF